MQEYFPNFEDQELLKNIPLTPFHYAAFKQFVNGKLIELSAPDIRCIADELRAEFESMRSKAVINGVELILNACLIQISLHEIEYLNRINNISNIHPFELPD